MMNFIICFKHRFFRKSTIAIILLGVALIGVSWFTRSFLSIQDYVQFSDPNHPYWLEYQSSSILSAEAFQRVLDSSNRISRSNAFSFYVIMNNGFLLYTLFGNLLVGMAVISFFQERKCGFTKLMLIRSGGYKQYIMSEAIAVSLTGWLYALLPCLIVWLLASLFSPDVLPQGQSIFVTPFALLKSLHQGNTVVFAYLIVIIIKSLQFIFITLLAFAFSLIVQRAIILLFIPLFYVIVMNFLKNKIYVPSVDFNVMGANQIMSFAPTLFNCFYTCLIALIVFIIFTKKERTINA